MTAPEALARPEIDIRLRKAAWTVHDVAALTLSAGSGIAVREYPLKAGHGLPLQAVFFLAPVG